MPPSLDAHLQCQPHPCSIRVFSMNRVRPCTGAIPAPSLRDAEATGTKSWPGLRSEKTPELLQVLFPPELTHFSSPTHSRARLLQAP